MFFLYNWLVLPLLRFLSFFVSRFGHGKIAETLRGQRQAHQKLREKLKDKKPKGPVLWVHVSSAGEFLQAKPVIEAVKSARPEVFVALTFISPSGMNWAKDYAQADFVGYGPVDSRRSVRDWLELLQPKILLLVKFDIWPNMVLESQQQKLKIFLISATLTPDSQRHNSAWKRNFFQKIYAKIDHIFCVGEQDLELFRQTNPRHPDLRVVGDTRVDSVLQRQELSAQKPLSEHLQALRKAHSFILVVGSAWTADGVLILPCWKRLREKHPEALLILTPHEPNARHLAENEDLCQKAGLSHLRLEKYLQATPGVLGADVLVIDRVGLLADLYRIGDGAFVGAGVGGVHNTMEPAAWGLPVVFRPVYHNAPEAIAMVHAKIFTSVADIDECYQLLESWMANFPMAREIGKKGRLFLEKSKGATYICVENILRELP